MLKALKKTFIGSFYRVLMYDYKNLKNNFKACISSLFRFSNAIIYLQTPLHGNVGDLAIAEASLQWLNKNIVDIKVFEFVYGEPTILHKIMLGLAIRKKDLIVLHGGGNLGTWYPAEENYREYIIKKYKKNNIIVFPQSVFFDDNDPEKNYEIGKVYSNHLNLLVCVRDDISFNIAKKYLNCNIELYPDIVLSYEHKYENSSLEETNKDILFCIRNDREKNISQEKIEKLANEIEQLGFKIKYQDTHIGHHVTLKTRKAIVDKMLNCYANAGLVVTDRFHGGIFAYITGTPCIVLEPKDHKVKGGFKWLKRAGNIIMPESIDDINSEILKLYNMKISNQIYDDEFSTLKKYILSKFN